MLESACHFQLEVQQQLPMPLYATLQCQAGELLALVGPSGSGKSSLVRIIAGLMQPTTGQIRCGSDVWFDHRQQINWSPQSRHIGYVPQHFGLFPHMTALENVAAGLSHCHDTERNTRARTWLKKMRLTGLEGRRPAELSGGQQQRVALARALAREPNILLLDEPFSAVDRTTRDTLYVELAELKQELAIPTIMVTHDLDEALLLADQMCLLAQGVTIQSASPKTILAQPVNEVAARLVGVRNIFDGVIHSHDLDAKLTWIQAGTMRLASKLGSPATLATVGTPIRWMMPTTAVRLPNLSDGTMRSTENHLQITILQMLTLGDEVRLTATMPNMTEPLYLEAPLSLAQKLGLQIGVNTEVVLSKERIHIF